MRSRRVPAVLAVANPVSNMGPSASEAAIPPELASPGLSLLQIYSILRAYRLQALIIAVVLARFLPAEAPRQPISLLCLIRGLPRR